MNRRIYLWLLMAIIFSGDLTGSDQYEKEKVVIQEQDYGDPIAGS